MKTSHVFLISSLFALMFLQPILKTPLPIIAVKENFEIQGHRGCRGLLPENTLPGFIKALDLGVTTLELDVVISQDLQVIVSHEPFLHHTICSDSLGNRILESQEMEYNLYHMDYDHLKTYDCGQQPHQYFPHQEKISAFKPRLKDIIVSCDHHTKSTNRPLSNYNIEIKFKQKWVNNYHPPINEYVDLVMQVVLEHNIATRTTIQCFDFQLMQYLKTNYPDQKSALLVDNFLSPDENLERLNYTPEVYAPHFRLVDQDLVDFCKEHDMKLIPWTVNHVNDLQRILEFEVDGIITDYPDRLREMIKL